jgi:hypothetical protein
MSSGPIGGRVIMGASGMLAVASFLSAALATVSVRAEPARVGARAGLSVAYLSAEGGPSLGGAAGMLVSIPIGDGRLMVEPALVFSMKGGGWGAGEGGETLHYDYLELPLLLRYGGRGVSFVCLGLAPALLVYEGHASQGGSSGSRAKPFDVSLVGQVGHEWQDFRLDLGFELGIVEADDSHSAAPAPNKNRAVLLAMTWLL